MIQKKVKIVVLLTKVFALSAVWFLLFCMFSSMNIAEETEEIDEDFTDNSQNVDVKNEITERELLELRSLYAKHYIRPTGTRYAVISATPLHYYDEDIRTWQDINTTIEPSDRIEYMHQNVKNNFRTYFSHQIGNGILLEYNDSWLLMKPLGTRVSVPQRIENKVCYRNAFDNIDVEYKVTSKGLKEDIILKNYTTQNTFSFIIEYHNGYFLEDGDTYSFFSGENKVWKFEPLSMEDAKGERGMVSLNLIDVGVCKLAVINADATWLGNPSRVYPVRIDPSMSWQPGSEGTTTYITESSPDYNSGNGKVIWAGKSSGYIVRSLIKFDVSGLGAGSEIVSSEVELYQENSPSANVRLVATRITSNWAESTVTYNTKPGYDPSVFGIVHTSSVTSGTKVSIDLTNLVKGWYSGTYTNYGFYIMAEGDVANAATQFSSDDSDTPENRPKLTVEYVTGTWTSISTYTSGKDTYISKSSDTTNYGTSSVLCVGSEGTEERNILVQISLSSVPAYSTIHAAYLRLYALEPSSAYYPKTGGYCPIKIDWSENTVTWWNIGLNYYDTNYYQTKVMRSRAGYYSFDITTIVQKWINNEMANYGITLLPYTMDTYANFYSKEGQGNTPLIPIIFVMYTPDTTPPTSTANVISGTLGSNGWYVSDVVVRITGSDSESGVGTIKYGTTNPPTNSFAGSSYDYTVNTDGQRTIYYQAIDKAGNAGSIGSITIKRDVNPPICSAAVISGTLGTNGWYVSDVTVRITASDVTSGVDTICYGDVAYPPSYTYQGTTCDITFNTNGYHDLYYWAVDKAGLDCWYEYLLMKIDKTLPTSTATVISGTLGSNGWYLSDVIVNISASDTLSGIKGIYYGTTSPPSNYCGGTSLNYPINSDGVFTIYYRATDNAGNNGSINSIVVKRDSTIPTSSASVISGTHPPDSSWYNTDVTLRITGTDATSGVNCIRYGPTTPPTNTYPGSTFDYTITSEGVNVVYYRATDNAGNNGSISLTSIAIDKTAPTSSSTVISGTLGSNGWYVTNPTIRITGSDSGSGVKLLYIGTTNPPINSYIGATCDYTFSNDGTYTLYYRALDNAGNNGTVNSILIKIDKTPPQNPVIDIGFDNPNYWFVGSYIYYTLMHGTRLIFVNLTLNDLVSGISYISCTCTNTLVDTTPADGFNFTFSFMVSPTTPYNISLQAVDNAGNILNYTYPIYIVCDNSTPTCTLVAPDLVTDNSPYTVTAISSDANSDYPSGISTTYLDYFYSDSGTPTTERSSMLGESTEGIYYYRAYCIDNVSNPSQIVSKKVIVDRTAPNAFISSILENSDFITVSGNTIYYSNLGNSAFTICIDASDNVALYSVSGSNAFSDSPSVNINGTSSYVMLNYTIEQGSTWTGSIYITITDIAGHNFTISLNVEIASPLIPIIKEITLEIFTGVIYYNSSINTLFFESNSSGVLTIYIEVEEDANAVRAEGSLAFSDTPLDDTLESNYTFCIIYTIEKNSISPSTISITVFNNVGECASVSFSVRKLNDFSASILSVTASDNIDYLEETNTLLYPKDATAWFTVCVLLTDPGVPIISAEGEPCFGDSPQGIIQNSFVYAFMYTIEQSAKFEGSINFTFKDATGRNTSTSITVRIIKEFGVQFEVTETTGGEFLYYDPIGRKLYYGTGACSFSITVSAIFYQSNYMKVYGSSAFGEHPISETNSLPLIATITYTIEANPTPSPTITIIITAEDEFGRKEIFNLEVIHDITPPKGLEINAPNLSNGTPYLVTTQNAYDSESGLLSVYLGVFSQDSGEPNVECNSIPGNISEGVYYYRALAIDRVGNKANVSVKTIVDKSPPSASILQIEQESGVLEIIEDGGIWYVRYGKDGGSFVVTLHAEDSYGIANCTSITTLASDLELTKITSTGNIFYLYYRINESKNNAGGLIRILVYDFAGRDTELNFRVYRVTQPLGYVTLNATREGKDVILNWTKPTSTARIVSYEIYRDSKARPTTLLTTVTAENQLRYRDVSQVKSAYYLVVAVDVFGNKGLDVNGVYVHAFHSTKKTVSEFPWWLIGLALVCLGLVFAFVALYLAKKRKQSSQLSGYYQSANQASPSMYNPQQNMQIPMQAPSPSVTPIAQPVYGNEQPRSEQPLQQITQYKIQQTTQEQRLAEQKLEPNNQNDAIISHAAELQRRAETTHVINVKKKPILQESKMAKSSPSMPSTAIISMLSKPTMCGKCHSIMKKDVRAVQCACGKEYHIECAKSIGKCVCGIDISNPVQSNVSKLSQSTGAVSCSVCRGIIKPGLMVYRCDCGSALHETCAARVGRCPKCDTPTR